MQPDDPDGSHAARTSPEVNLGQPIDMAIAGTPGETSGPRVDTRGVSRGRGRGRGRGRDPLASDSHSFPTMERPTRAKKNYRPAQAVFDYSIQRRTSEQVKADQAKAKTEAAAAEAVAKAHQLSQRDRVAALEDAKQAEEYARSLEDTRPDLLISNKSVSNADVETLSDSHLMLDELMGSSLPREPLIELPQLLPEVPVEHSQYRNSSHSNSNEYLTGWLGETAAAVEEDNRQDFVVHQDDESEASEAASEVSQAEAYALPSKARCKGKAKAKPEQKRGTFRASVNNARQVQPPPPSQIKKRTVDGGPGATKRFKPSEPGGLIYDWKKNAGLLEHIASRHPIQFVDDEDDIIEVKGEFDRAERPETLNAVREAKPSTVRVNSVSVGTKITPRSMRPKPTKFVVDDLPFPHPRAAYSAKWQKVFRPTLLGWASTFPDPYATNTLLEEAIVLDMWDTIYPDIDLDDQERKDTGDKLIYLAGNILNDWRTTIGTGALNVIRTYFLLPANRFHKERIAYFVGWALHPTEFNFIFRNPNGQANEKQGFRSEMMLNVYAIHLKKVAGCVGNYGDQIGALALCTAAAERALAFWSTGEDMSMKIDENGKSKLASIFGEVEWGAKTRGWSKATSRLTSEQWKAITNEATVRGKRLPHDDHNGEDVPDVDPRAVLEL